MFFELGFAHFAQLLEGTKAISIVAFAIGAACGVLTGALVAGCMLMERAPHPWTIVLRLPLQLHRQLKRAAKNHRVSLATEIIDRLANSFNSNRPATSSAVVTLARRQSLR